MKENRKAAAVALSIGRPALALALVVLQGCGDDPPTADREPTPSVVPGGTSDWKARVEAALTNVRSVRSEVVQAYGAEHGFQEQRWSVLQTAAGDFRAVSPDGRQGAVQSTSLGADWVWEPERPGPPGAPRRYERASGGDLAGRERTGLPPGQFESVDVPNPIDLARRALGRRDAAGQETTYEGRAVWEVQGPSTDTGTFADHDLIVIDRQTGLPLREQQSKDGVPVLEIRINGTVLDGPVSPDDFRPPLPAGVQLPSTDLGYHGQTLDEARRAAGVPVLVPQRVPPGYALSGVAVGTKVDDTSPMAFSRSVALAYRRGFRLITIEVGRLHSPAQTGAALRTPPSAVGRQLPPGWVEPRRFRLTGGVFDGADALLAGAQPWSEVAALLAAKGETGVLISGPVSEDELLDLVRSLA